MGVRTEVSGALASGRTHQVVGGAHGRVAGVGRRQPNHAVDVFLDVLDEALDYVDLGGARLDELLDRVVDLLFVLTSAPEPEELLLLRPLGRVRCHAAGLVVHRGIRAVGPTWVRQAPAGRLVQLVICEGLSAGINRRRSRKLRVLLASVRHGVH